MLFNSFEFLFLFLPVLLFVFFRLGLCSRRLAGTWLVAGSIFFYGYWNPVYVGLLLISILFNYLVGYCLTMKNVKKSLLVFGVASNLTLLAYYKYANFFINTFNNITGINYSFAEILLPLGISFFTFTQIAFLVDAARGEAKEFDFIHYVLFVTYFPHLIAGPVLHHKEMMPQFSNASTYRFNSEFMVVGLSLFAIGLFKKAVLADGVAPYALPVFAAVEMGESPALFQAWGGVLAYSLQLYFDFSGYSDMAIGLSYMIGVKLPLNFNSPYKSASITEFWRRWHMTLSRFLRDYLYIPLGGNRKGPARKRFNLFITMLLGGLWHGAGWNFVVWGGLHGLFLVAHQLWVEVREGLGWLQPSALGRIFSVLLTFISVVVAWVFFRAHSLTGAMIILAGMSGSNGITLPDTVALHAGNIAPLLKDFGVVFTPGGGRIFVSTYLWILGLLPVIFLAPNSQEIMRGFQPALTAVVSKSSWLIWAPSVRWALIMALVLSAGLLSLMKPSEFLYFQF